MSTGTPNRGIIPYESQRLNHTATSGNGDPFEEDEVRASLLAEYFLVLMHHKVLIVGLAFFGIIASVLLHITTQPVYQTRTSLNIQTLNSDFMNMKTLDPTAGAPSDTALQTQIKLLESESLRERIQARITSEPHPISVSRTDTISHLKNILHLGKANAISYQSLLNNTADGVKVKPLGLTQLIEITCDSWDPNFAARYCNTLTSEFQAEDLESRGDQAKHTSDWLMHQAADIRQKAEDSQQRLIAATGGNGLILAQENDTVGEDRLRQMQGELVKAQADRMEKEAQVSVTQSSSGDSLPNSAQSLSYAADKQKLADLQNQVAALIPPLTEANPRIIHLRSEIKQVEASIAQETTSSTARLENEYVAAKHRESLLQMAYQVQQQSVSSDLERGSQVDLLRREVQSEQQLYQTLLQRAKEAGFASAMQATTIRVVDPARKPMLPLYPRRLMTACVGAVVGATLGIIVSFFKDRNSSVLRLPGESERFLNLGEIGIIPSLLAVRGPRADRKGVSKELSIRSPSSELTPTQANVWNGDFSLIADAYRSAMLSLRMADSGSRGRTYVISSPNAGEGKTTVLSNLGIALSKSKLRVVLIDGDLRKPTLHTVLQVPNERGLRDILRGDVGLTEPSLQKICLPTAFQNLSVIPSGAGHESVGDLLHSPHFPDLMGFLSRSFDVVLVDTPPMLHISDARIFAAQTHGAILIFRAGVTTYEQARHATTLFDRDHIRIIGSILNDFNPRKEGKYGYYNSYYAYQKSSLPDKAVRS